MLVSAKHQHESAIDIPMFPPSWTSRLIHSSRLLQSPGLSSLSHRANFHWLSILSQRGLSSACWGFPGSSDGEESACWCRRPRFNSWVGKIPWRRDRLSFQHSWASLVTQMVKNLPVMQETWVWSLGQEGPLEEGMTTYASILAWRIPMNRGAW